MYDVIQFFRFSSYSRVEPFSDAPLSLGVLRILLEFGDELLEILHADRPLEIRFLQGFINVKKQGIYHKHALNNTRISMILEEKKKQTKTSLNTNQ